MKERQTIKRKRITKKLKLLRTNEIERKQRDKEKCRRKEAIYQADGDKDRALSRLR